MLVDGVDVRELDPDLLWGNGRLRAAEAVPLLGHRRVATCASGGPTPPRTSCGQALEVAQASGFVQAMPDGLDSAIDAGRHERVGRPAPAAVDRPGARRRPEIYVFDDSFSALDLATDARLRAALAPAHRPSAAVVIVAQRVSTIATADQILVLEDGELVGRGTHDELIATCPTYAEIVAVADRRGARGMSDGNGDGDGDGHDGEPTIRRSSPTHRTRRAGAAARAWRRCRHAGRAEQGLRRDASAASAGSSARAAAPRRRAGRSRSAA